jgi:hypothetical protein
VEFVSASAPLEELAEVRWAVEAEAPDRVLGPTNAQADALVPGVSRAVGELTVVGRLGGLGELRQVMIKRPGRLMAVCVRGHRFVLAEVDPSRGTARVEQALEAWRKGEAPAPAVAVPAGAPLPITPTPLPQWPLAEAGFAGSLAEFGVPDVLEFLRGAHRSGVLLVSSGAKAGVLRFRKGWIIGVSLVAPRDADAAARGDTGPIDAAKLDELVRLGGKLEADSVNALHAQVMQALREFVAWTQGEFAFTRDTRPDSAPTDRAQIDCRQAMFEVLQELDEAAEARPATMIN